MSEPGKAQLIPFRDEMGTPLVGDAPRLLLLGSGELGREVAIEAVRLGAEVVAVDRYSDAPAMQVAHRSHVIPMTDSVSLRRVVHEESPTVIVPEIEQIDTATLVDLEAEGWAVIPNARATQATMNRELIRRVAAEAARVPTSQFRFADSSAEARRAAQDLGFPVVVKAIVSSSGHGMTVARRLEEVDEAYRAASEEGRVASSRVMLEEFISFDLEVTVLTLRHYNSDGSVVTSTMAPIGHSRPGTLYHESWHPAELSGDTTDSLARVATAVTDQLGGLGIFGVECFVKGTRVFFSEVSPRPHDTGLVTLASQWNSEFALHARAVLGLPYVGEETIAPSAAHVILAPSVGTAPRFGALRSALSFPGTRLFLFGKPDAYPHRRLGVVVARAASVVEARGLAERAAHQIEAKVRLTPPGEAGAALRGHLAPES